MQKTTITLPTELMTQLKYYAIKQKSNVSQVIRESIQAKLKVKQASQKSILDLVGSVKPTKKYTLPNRQALYEQTLQKKISS